MLVFARDRVDVVVVVVVVVARIVETKQLGMIDWFASLIALRPTLKEEKGTQLNSVKWIK